MIEMRCLKNVVINTIINLKHTIYKQHAINNAIKDLRINTDHINQLQSKTPTITIK